MDSLKGFFEPLEELELKPCPGLLKHATYVQFLFWLKQTSLEIPRW